MKKLFLVAVLVMMPAMAHAQMVPIPVQGSNAAEGSHAFSGTALYSLTINWNATSTARYLMIFDGAVPSNGSTTQCATTQAAGCLAFCDFAPNSTTAQDSQSYDWTLHPIKTQNAVNAAMSTGAGCGTLTKDGNNDFFYAQVAQ